MPLAAARGGFLAFIGLLFGLNALRYPIGHLDHPGPGLFPLIVSGGVLVLSAGMLAGVRRQGAGRLIFRYRNIAILLAALVGFVLASRISTTAVGIVVLVFAAGCAGRSPSFTRSAMLAVVLVAVAFGFERLLGLRLRVF